MLRNFEDHPEAVRTATRVVPYNDPSAARSSGPLGWVPSVRSESVQKLELTGTMSVSLSTSSDACQEWDLRPR
jgi:hypothetical protein